MVRAAPGCEHLKPFAPSRGADSVGVRPGTVGVQILMGLESIVVSGVHDLEQGVVARVDPAMRARPCVARHQDQVLRPGLADRAHGGVGCVQPLQGRHFVRLVHQAEPDVRVIAELRRHAPPEVGEVGVGNVGAADDLAVVARAAVWVQQDDDVLLAGGRHHPFEPLHFGGDERCLRGGLDGLPVERQSNDVHPLGGEVSHFARVGIDVVRSVDGGLPKMHVAELPAGQVCPRIQQGLCAGGRRGRQEAA